MLNYNKNNVAIAPKKQAVVEHFKTIAKRIKRASKRIKTGLAINTYGIIRQIYKNR